MVRGIETPEAVYDAHSRRYIDFVDAVLAAEPSLFRILAATVERMVGPRIQGADVVDIACGEGYLSRHLIDCGARSVLGVDLSRELIEEARRRGHHDGLAYATGDAQSLAMLDDAAIDVAVCQMAIMDISDHRAAFRAAARILKRDGVFVFSLLHPCFEGPYSPPDEPPFLVDEHGAPTAVAVRRYGCEGHWQSEGAGLRGHVGSYHRMVSTYLNDLVSSGLRLERVEEPLPAVEGLFSRVPRVMVIAAAAT
jgi:SAM-dependent methyltransferase